VKNILPKAKVYIDGANVFYTQKDIGFSIDWEKTRKYLQESYDILEIRYYVGVKQDDEKMASYLIEIGKNSASSSAWRMNCQKDT